MSSIHLDFETCSTADLRKVGLHTYAESVHTKVLMARWTFNGYMQRWNIGDPVDAALLDLFDAVRGGLKVVAHNAEFEWVIWNEVFRKQVPLAPQLKLSQVRCTMAKAMFHGLPGSLDMVAQAMGLIQQKDMAGHALMMRMARPRSFDPQGNPVWWHETDPARMDPLGDYCAQDVRVEVEIDERLPDLSPDEQKLWELNATMNLSGIGVDLSLVKKMWDYTKSATAELNDLMREHTEGAVKRTTDVKGLLAYFHAKGMVKLPDVSKATLKAMLNSNAPDELKTVASIRLDAAKSSTAKLSRIEAVAGNSGLLRGLIAYYGANRTGRYAGRLVQPQNFPRGLGGDDFDNAIHYFQTGKSIHGEDVVYHPGQIMDTVSGTLRGTLVPPAPYGRLVVGDFSQIEARIIAWLAGQDDVLDVFSSGQDVYVYAAQKFGSDNRTLGKVATLGLGFQMGFKRFIETAKTYGLDLSPEHAEEVVNGWREANARIVKLWYDFDRDVRTVLSMDDVTSCGKVVRRFPSCVRPNEYTLEIGTAYIDKTRCMYIQLPSKRKLWYWNAQLVVDNDPRLPSNRRRDEGREVIAYQNLDNMTNQWTWDTSYGGKFAENVTQAVARDVMARALYKVASSPAPIAPLLTVHDELVAGYLVSKLSEQEATDQLEQLMTAPPAWAPGLPIAAEVFTSERYRK